MTLNRGFFIRQIEKTAPTINALTDTILDLALRHIVLKILDNSQSLPAQSVVSDDLLVKWITYLNSEDITVWGWADFDADNLSTSLQALVMRIQTLNLTHVVLRPRGNWQVRDANIYVSMLSEVLPENVTLAIANPPFEKFPLSQFVTICDTIMPLIALDTNSGNLSGNLQRIQTSYAQYFKDKRLMPVAITSGKIAGTRPYYWFARPDQITEFLNMCTALEIEAVNFLAWQDVRYQQALWQAIEKWDYTPPQRTPPKAVPAQGTTNTATTGATTRARTTATQSNLPPEEQLHQYGVALGTDDGGSWSAEEIQNMLNVVIEIAEAYIPLFQATYQLNDPIFGFQLLYAPLVIKRNPNNDVNPGAPFWYGKNSNGFEMVFGNKMFIKNSEPAPRIGESNLRFNSPQIIAHEVSHTINWRYPQLASLNGANGQLDDYYAQRFATGNYQLTTGENVRLASTDTGYTFAARSNAQPYELVTDAIANFTYDGLTIGDTYSATENLEGQARLMQLSVLLTHVIKHRVQNYGNLDAVLTKMGKKAGSDAIALAQPAITAMKSSNYDARLAQLK